jgi:hypothetical protein
MCIENRDWVQSITDDTDADVAFRVLASAVEIEPRTMDNKRFFSQDAAEELADIFAVRHGAGRALMLMRSKTQYRKIDDRMSYLKMAGWALAGMVSAPVVPIVGLPLAAISILSILCQTWKGVAWAKNLDDVTTFKQTATKVRNQFVEQLKSSKLPKEDVAAILESISLADKLIQGYKGDFDPGILARFVDMFRRGKMDARSSREYTDKLEVLVANDLFVRAAQLSAR